ncbi:MAG: excinuclease ABC subunit C [Actinobacteria bacterium]|jgi:excinuclease ABC subunit C|nr:excinuclease ABC subunit C [Actinomycetota bacterium]
MANPQSYRPTNIPEHPGVYRFYNEQDKVIYVGKAKSLKNRLSNYFQANLATKTHRMVHEAVRVDWTIVSTELEALALEFSWIKQYQPKYNVQFKDDKSYPYLALSLNDEYPLIFITRKDKRPGLKYFGPYTNAWALRNTFEVLLKVFPVRSCSSSNFTRAQRSKRQCLLGDIGKCAAPCVGWISKEDHKKLAERLNEFMESGMENILPKLHEEMSAAAANEEFERAARLRDQIESFEKAQKSTEGNFSDDLDGDFISIYHDGFHAAGSIFSMQRGSVKGSRSWIVDQEMALEGQDELTALLYSIYGTGAIPVPRNIYINSEPADKEQLEQWLGEIGSTKVDIKVPQRGEKVELLATVKRNAQYSLIQFLSKRSTDAAVSGKALIEIQQTLNLAKPPLRIECFDISNISGTSVVASMVVFEDGLAKKSEYRRFIINTDEGFDDTRAMHQVITRRLKRLIDDRAVDSAEVAELGGKMSKFSYPPQLIVVDGGAPQVNAAARALSELGITDIALCGLAKRLEEVWLPGSPDPLILPRSSEGLYLLQRIRDEAHRFAITFHRSRRSKIMLESVLDEIPQLGQVRRRALLERFGSVAAIRKASREEIAATPGIGTRTASVIEEYLNSITSQKIDITTGEIISGPEIINGQAVLDRGKRIKP